MIFDMTGGGAGLNFKVVGGPSQRTRPEGPSENMIWVDTEIEIANTSLSIEAPENPEPGAVWITTEMYGPIKFSAFKNKCVMVYPKSVSQYVDEQWTELPAAIYQSENWHELPTEVVLYANGEFNSALLGTLNGDLNFSRWDNDFTHSTPLDLSRFNRVEFVTSSRMYQSGTAYIRDASGTVILSVNISEPGVYAIDVSDLSDSYFLRIHSSGNADDNHLSVSRITLKV